MTPSGPVNSSINIGWSSGKAVDDLFSHQSRRNLSRFGVGCTSAANALDSRFLSGSLWVECARLTRVLNSVVGIADVQSDLSQ